VVAELRGIVHAISAAHLVEAIERAEEIQAELLLIELDTPGGLVNATETIVKGILNARTPVVVHVQPKGAHAASAGFFILMAADVAAMAPTTRTGASSPIGPSGQDTQEDVAWQKAAQDLAALIRGTAKERGRNWEEAEKAVTEAKAWDAATALEEKLIDLIAVDRDDLLDELNGWPLPAPEGEPPRVLRTTGAVLVPVSMNWKERIQNVLFHPALMFLFLALGALGLYVEFQNPGLIFPGVVGAVCLAIFLYGSQVLPVNYFGVVLIALAVILFILEIKVISYGMLTLAGLGCLVVGAWIVFPRNIEALAIPLQVFLPITLTIAAVMLAVLWLVIRAQRDRVSTGVEGMVGERGSAATDLDPRGKVFVHGEYWEARATRPVTQGTPVTVRAVRMMELEVEPDEEEP
jgi:membrane-bound serine protease (ClpP class)